MIHLHTLGDALIRVGEKEVRPTAPLLFAALLYLGLERGRRVPRTALQELFFPDVDERSGAHSLRQLLYKLRQLGAPLEADAATVGLPVDQVRDDAVVELGVTNGHSNGIEKYGRGFLPDYAPRLSERYGEWLEQRREAVVSNIRRQLIGALKASREGMNWPAVEKYAHLILELDAFNEEATLALAEATALTGAKAKALEILTRYERETGRTDLRLPPSLLKRRISSIAVESPAAFNTPFVGRQADAEALRRQMLQAQAGRPSAIVIGGEPGIGKTRLVEEAARLAVLEGVQVHVVRCQAHYASRPLSVFIELVPSLLSAPGALGISPDALSQLKLLTDHTDRRPDHLVDRRDTTARSELLLSALRDLVDAVASETPTVLVVEDAHRADVESLTELHALIDPSSHRQLVLVCTTRTTDALKQAGLVDDTIEARRLRPLQSEAMQTLARHLLPTASDSSPDVASWCVQTAAGNPLFLEMLCGHYTQTGQAYAVPVDLSSATKQRIEQLPRECRRLLQFSSLLGKHATLDALRSLTSSTQQNMLGAIERLEDEGYLRIDGDAARTSHDLMSECTLELVAPLTRRLMHASVAAHLELRYDATRDASLL